METTQEFLKRLWAEAGSKSEEPEGCKATYDHFAHDDCPGTITPEEYARQNPDVDNIEYLEFYHETYIFDDEVYGIYLGQDGIARIYAGNENLITHEDGRTQEIPWACVREWSNVKVK